MFRRILAALAVVLLLAIAAGTVYVATRQNLKFDAPYPKIAASADSAVVARGEYLMSSATDCAACHAGPGVRDSLGAGAKVPMSGGFHWDIPPGVIYARNITPDSATGIGALTDGQIARALRYGVGHDGRALLPFMEMQGLSDEDLVAVISYLRRQEPVHNLVPAHRYSLLGKVVKATLLANPVGPKDTPPAVSPHGATVENGSYLAGSVSLCWACHTQRDMASGKLVGPLYGGATGFDEGDGKSWSPPNLTKDPTGVLGKLNEDQFVARFREGRLIAGSPMPWQNYSRMSEEDLRAIYRFLETVPAAKNDVGPVVVEVAKK